MVDRLVAVGDNLTLPSAVVVPTVSGVKPSGGDDTTAINAYLTGAAGVRRLVGAYNISDAITVPAGVTLDASGATITQTGTNKRAVILGGNGAAITGGTIVGKGTDYVAGSAITACGVYTTGTTGCRVIGVTITGVAGASIEAHGTTGLSVRGCRIVGVGTPTITAGDGASCYGIYLDGAAVWTRISGCDISATCQGIITGISVTHLTLSDLQIHDIPGQHGVYVQNGTGLVVSGLDVATINLNGFKLQLSTSSAADSKAATIRGASFASTGETALSVNNTAADLTSAKRIRSLTISGVSVTDCWRALYLGSVRGGSVSNIAAYNTTGDGITFLDCHDTTLTNAVLDVVGRVGLRFTSATGSSQTQVTCQQVRISNPANTNTASNLYGVYLAQGSNITLDGLVITATNGFLQYGIFLASSTAGDQQTFSLRNSDLSGDTGTTGRFQATTTNVRDWTNVRFSGGFLNKPTGVVAVTAVP